MDLHHLQTFIVVAEEKNITRAARRLYTTPSAISMQIKALEDELRVQLFTRTNQGVTMTPKGEQLREKAFATLQAAQDMVNYATQLHETLLGTVSIGLCSDPLFLEIPRLAQQVATEYAGISLVLEQSTSAQIISAVAEERLNVGFVFGSVENRGLIAQHLGKIELVIAVPTVWEETFDTSDWKQIAAQPWVSVGKNCPFQNTIDAYLAQHGLICSHRVQIDDDRSRSELVKAGLGLSLLEHRLANQGVAHGTMKIASVAPLYCDLSIIFQAHKAHDPLVSCISRLIHGLFHETYPAPP